MTFEDLDSNRARPRVDLFDVESEESMMFFFHVYIRLRAAAPFFHYSLNLPPL